MTQNADNYALQFENPASQSGSESRDDESRSHFNLVALAWRSRWLIFFLTMVGGGVAWAVVERVEPLYASMSRIYVELNLPQILDGSNALRHSQNYLYTQAELIRSSAVIAAAIDKPENADLESFKGVDNAVALLRKNLRVVVGTQDEIINVSVELPNARDAAQLANSVVDAYITQYAEERRTDTVEVLNILRNEKNRRDEELEQRRKELDAFREQHIAISVQVDEDNVITRRFALVAQELNQTELELLQTKSRYARIKDMYESPTRRQFLLEMIKSEQSYAPDVQLDAQIQHVEQELSSQRAQWGEKYPSIRLLKESLASLEKRRGEQQKVLLEGYVDSLRRDFELLDNKKTELQRAYDEQFKMATQVSSQSIKLASLEEAFKRTESLCDILDERIKEVNLSEEVGAMNVSIMEVAAPASLPSYPVRSKFLAMGACFGSLLGFGLAWLREFMDHRLKSVEEIGATLQLPVIGALPFMTGSVRGSEIGRIVASLPKSMVAEAVRTLRTALHFGIAGKEAKVFCITSPLAGDGKSTVASNLAIAMAQAGNSVLLIDADLRKPTQHTIFSVPNNLPGLVSILGEHQPLAEAIVATDVDLLDLIPCGRLPINPVELLNNGLFEDFLEEARGRYDKIIIDSPPVMPVADARIIAAKSDCTLLVLRAERSNRRLSIAARNELWRVRVRRLGVVVNAVPTRKQNEYGYGSGYGYPSYGDVGHDEDNKRRTRKVVASLPLAETAVSSGVSG